MKQVNKLSGAFSVTIYFIILVSRIKCQEVIASQSNSNQSLINNSSKANPNAPSFTESLGYGFLCVTLTNLCALVGIVFTFLKKYRFFPTILSFMVATAVGSLLSTSIIVLIPEALQIIQPTGNNNTKDSDSYVIKSITVCIGVFFFYILEFLLRLIPQCFQKKKTHSNDKSQNGFHIDQFNHHHHHHQLSYHQQERPSLVIPVEPVADGDKDGPIVGFTPNRSNQSKTMIRSLVGGETDLQCESPPTVDIMNHLPSYEELSTELQKPSNNKQINTQPIIQSTHTLKKHKSWQNRLRDLEPVAWMIFIGDGAHNFMDGLSIGVGFTQSIGLGISLTLAVLCEELPHELGDIAVLLRSGLTVPMAMLFNFISACSAYIGLFVGLSVGDLNDVAPYVFALTGGFFMYIALADMLPEMRAMEDAKRIENGNCWAMFLTNLIGLLFGFGCIVTITLTSQYINI
ncbi:solute carrier family 39 (zinc transporter), member 14 [Schistosoma bovis]|uniref:Solute carrier family 39 (Zinc transporter), member 14 n=1 Tax=Schistosoma bovis TaxID=6184 RepID=A0A430QBW2_SCHBO|nr:solute carrier family 39 (zinc transporter), member 14 [Schistosoma bovis]CAH8539850.1 unnamed protein product [Schistosoma bovis]